MNPGRTMARSEYLYWAKTAAAARFNLATSGIAGIPETELPFRADVGELSPAGSYGYAPLLARLAARYGMPPDCVVTTTGASMANFLAMAALLGPGDEALIELPAYEPLLAVARYLGASIRRFQRSFENDFQIRLEELEDAMTKNTRLIVLTNLHNPSGVFLGEQTLRAIGDIARRARARVLVNEAYLDMRFGPQLSSAAQLGEPFVITSSLTKAYGLSGLRCGWIVSTPELAERMWRLNDLFGQIPVHLAERLSVLAFDHLDELASRAQAILDRNRPLLDRFLDSRTDLQAVRSPAGTLAFPRLAQGDADAFCRYLREKYETSVVPGRFFEMPRHLRIGVGGDTDAVRGGLERLGTALDAFGR
jgi:aspartate/methionine/tyrosine aminotransferase